MQVTSLSGEQCESLAQMDVATGRADQHFHFAGFSYPAIFSGVEEPESLLIEMKGNCLCFTGSKFNFCERLEFLLRARQRTLYIAHVKLDYFLACAPASVGDIETHIQSYFRCG